MDLSLGLTPNLVVRPITGSIFTRIDELQIGNTVQPRGKREWENSKQELQETIVPKEEYRKPEIQDKRDNKIIKKEGQSFPNSKQELKETKTLKRNT